MSEVVIAESIDNTDEQVYKYTIDMIDINTILFNIMNTDTGINYKLHIKKNSDWCQENLYKTQNDFSQLYQMLNDCVLNEDSMFKYKLKEETENINFKMEMKNDTKFFKLDLEFKLERHISDNGIIDDRLNSMEYQFNIYKDKTNETINKLQEDNEILKKQILELIDFKLKLQEKNKKEYDWLNTDWYRNDDDTRLSHMQSKEVANILLLTGKKLPLNQHGHQYDDDGTMVRGFPDFSKYQHGKNIRVIDTVKNIAHCSTAFKYWFEHHMDTLLI